jgi:hypothetical protein
MRLLILLLFLFSLPAYSSNIDLDFLKEVSSNSHSFKLSQLHLKANEKKTISLGAIVSKSAEVFVYMTLSLDCKDKKNHLSIKTLEPGSEGIKSYFHKMQVVNKASLIDEIFLIGDNPEDDVIDGQWYLELKNKKNRKIRCQNLILTVHTRED